MSLRSCLLLIISCYFCSVASQVFPFFKNGRYGFIDGRGDTAQPAVFSKPFAFGKGYWAMNKNQWYLLDQRARIVTDTPFVSLLVVTETRVVASGVSVIELFEQNFASAISRDNFWMDLYDNEDENDVLVMNCIDSSIILDDKLHTIYRGKSKLTRTQDSENFLFYSENNKTGILSTSGKIVFPAIYDSVLPPLSCDFVVVKNKNKFGLAGRSGSLLIPFGSYHIKMPADVDSEKCTPVVAKTDTLGKTIFLDLRTGQEFYLNGLIVSEFRDDFFICEKIGSDGEYYSGIVNRRGEVLVPFIYSMIEFYSSNNWFKVIRKDDQNDYVGVIDSYGKTVLPAGNYDIENLLCGEIIPIKNGPYSFYNVVSGRSVISGKFYFYESYESDNSIPPGYIVTETKSKKGLFFLNGKCVIKNKYSYFYFVDKKLVIAEKDRELKNGDFKTRYRIYFLDGTYFPEEFDDIYYDEAKKEYVLTQKGNKLNKQIVIDKNASIRVINDFDRKN
jgi:hypothetical protein